MMRAVALLRGINVGGRKLPMSELRALCAELGWRDVETYIQSGSIVFAADEEPPALEIVLERAVEQRFGMKVPVVVRTAREWSPYLDRNPFQEVAREAPNRLLLFVSKKPPARGAVEALEARAVAGESIGRAGDGLWIAFPTGVGKSRLSPRLIDRIVGSSATSRNYRTAMKIKELLEP